VNAENSTLSGIMQAITAQTGMTVDGLTNDQRIFGTYGPASPREVLSALLDGMGYNVMMVGNQSNGAPRQLLLTPRSGGPASGGPANGAGRSMPVHSNNSDDDDDTSSQDSQDTTPLPPRPDVNQQQPPQQPPAGQPGQGQGQGQVKTPQQMLQELQQLRQQQQQQLQQSNPQ
jgi:hypothetical protein